MADLGAKDVFALSPSASEMFQLIVTVLHTLETELSKNIFQTVLRLVASRLDAFIVDGLIMNTKFSSGGADQFHFDMTRNLFPLFGQYTNRPALLFKQYTIYFIYIYCLFHIFLSFTESMTLAFFSNCKKVQLCCCIIHWNKAQTKHNRPKNWAILVWKRFPHNDRKKYLSAETTSLLFNRIFNSKFDFIVQLIYMVSIWNLD